MHPDTDRMATQLAALGYIGPGVGPRASMPTFWDEHGVAIGFGFVVLVLYVALVVALDQESDRRTGEVGRDR